MHTLCVSLPVSYFSLHFLLPKQTALPALRCPLPALLLAAGPPPDCCAMLSSCLDWKACPRTDVTEDCSCNKEAFYGLENIHIIQVVKLAQRFAKLDDFLAVFVS